MSGTEQALTPLHLIWRRLARPVNLVHAVPAVTGIPASHIADLVPLHLALSAPAGALLTHAHESVRHLGSTMSLKSRRCVGEVTGPILWAETLNARAHSTNGDDVFVCGEPVRDYSTPENRLLAAGLEAIVAGGRRLEGEAALKSLAPLHRNTVEARAGEARTWLGTRQLVSIGQSRPTARDITKVRHGRSAHSLVAAVELWNLRRDPLDPGILWESTDPVSRGQLRALALLVQAMERRDLAVPRYRTMGGELVAGWIRYRNWRRPTSSGSHGILFGDVLVDGTPDQRPAVRARAMADLERRAKTRMFCLVSDPNEAELALDLALGSRAASSR